MTAQGSAGSPATAGQAGNSDTLERLARVGLVAYGVVHLLVAWLALQLAWGKASSSVDQSGALATLAQQPLGKPLLWVLAVGLIALALWQAAEILRWRHGLSSSGDARTKAWERTAKAAAKTVIYLALAVMAIRYATGSGGSGGQSPQQVAGVFGWPAGRWLIGAAGLVVLGVGVYHVYKGVSKRFLKEIDLSDAPERARRLVTRLGEVGFPGKGVALGLVGGLLLWAAVSVDPAKVAGLDGALHRLLGLPAGRILLTLVAVGIASFGVYCFVRARYPERT